MKNKAGIGKHIFLVFSLIFLQRLLLFFCLDCRYFYDTFEYMVVDGFAWLGGNVDRYRLPLYPMFIDMFELLFGNNFGFFLSLFQLIFSLISVVFLYLTLRKLSDKRWICLLITYVYGTLNAVTGWDRLIITESLSLSLTVFALFGMISYLKEKITIYVIFTASVLTLGCFLRAVFAIYAGMFFGAICLIAIISAISKTKTENSDKKEHIIVNSAIALIPVILVLLYSYAFYCRYGAFTMSDSYIGQQLVVIFQNDYYKDSSDEEIRQISDKIVHSKYSFEEDDEKETLDPEIEKMVRDMIVERTHLDFDMSILSKEIAARWYVIHNFSPDRVKAFVKESKRNHYGAYLARMIPNMFEEYSTTRYKQMKDSKIAQTMSGALDETFSMIHLNIFHTLIVSLIELLVFVVLLIKKKELDWIRLGLGAFILSSIVLSLFGTNLEYARTAITALPFAFAAVALYLDHLTGRFSKTV